MSIGRDRVPLAQQEIDHEAAKRIAGRRILVIQLDQNDRPKYRASIPFGHVAETLKLSGHDYVADLVEKALGPHHHENSVFCEHLTASETIGSWWICSL